MALLFYNLALRLYALSLRLAAFFHPKAKLFLRGRKALLSRLKQDFSQEQRPVIWLHCASLGEFEQGRPVLEAIRNSHPGYALLLTFFSPSGFEVRKNYSGADYIYYLPLDSKRHARSFVEAVSPSLALFVKYEFWYHYLKTLQDKRIPAVLFSAHFQKKQPFFKVYGGLYRKMLDCYQQIFVQDESSEKLLSEIGRKNVQVVGDTRLDRAAAILKNPKQYPNVLQFKQDKKLILAGSSWSEDEVFLKKVMDALPGETFRLLLAPHEVHQTHIDKIFELFGADVCLWNADDKVLKAKKVAVVHTVGQLSYLYQYADLAWVGGGFGKGIHNTIEPAVFGVPVCFGPEFHRFREAEALNACGGAESIEDVGRMVALLQHPNKLKEMGQHAGAYVRQNLGATKAIMDYLNEKCL